VVSLEKENKVEVLIFELVGTISNLRQRQVEEIRPGSWSTSKT
jgi:hypothetical protein